MASIRIFLVTRGISLPVTKYIFLSFSSFFSLIDGTCMPNKSIISIQDFIRRKLNLHLLIYLIKEYNQCNLIHFNCTLIEEYGCVKIIFSVVYVYTVVIKNIAFQIFIILNETRDLDLRDRDTIYHGQSGKIEYSNNFIWVLYVKILE